ncbi:MAG: hypothetical protein R3D98_16595 [Candidatus Krumholzibacteriia bacterium]
MALLDRALVGPGITGTVTSALTGEPLAAEVIITEMNASNVGPRLCDQHNGQYHRFTRPGEYTLRVSYRDHVGQIIPVSVGSGWTVVDVALAPVTTGVQTTVGFRLTVPNPTRGGQHVTLRLADGSAPGRAELYDLGGRRGPCSAAGSPRVWSTTSRCPAPWPTAATSCGSRRGRRCMPGR